MPFGFRLIFLCWPLDPDSQAEAVSAGSQQTSVSGYKSSWKNSFCRPGIKLRESDLLKERRTLMLHMSTERRCCLTLTRGTLKTTGSMVDLVSIRATATSTSRTLHWVLGRKAKPWGKDKRRRSLEGDILDVTEGKNELRTLCGSWELKLLQSRKYGSSGTTS